MKRIIYVAGPYTAKEDFKRLHNIQKADEVNLQLWSLGYFAICPHKITAFYGGLCDESVFIEGGLEILRRCDAVVLVEGWESSGGTLGEIKEAMDLEIPVYENVEDFVSGIEIDYKNAKFHIDLWEKKREKQ